MAAHNLSYGNAATAFAASVLIDYHRALSENKLKESIINSLVADNAALESKLSIPEYCIGENE